MFVVNVKNFDNPQLCSSRDREESGVCRVTLPRNLAPLSVVSLVKIASFVESSVRGFFAVTVDRNDVTFFVAHSHAALTVKIAHGPFVSYLNARTQQKTLRRVARRIWKITNEQAGERERSPSVSWLQYRACRRARALLPLTMSVWYRRLLGGSAGVGNEINFFPNTLVPYNFSATVCLIGFFKYFFPHRSWLLR